MTRSEITSESEEMRLWQKMLILWLVFSASSSLLAIKLQNRQWYSFKGGDVSFQLPPQWKAQKDFMGMPLMILGPKVKNASRITIGVVPTNIPHSQWNPEELKKKAHQDYYRNTKKVFLEKLNGKITSIIPYKKEKWTNINAVHSIGHRYAINSVPFVEKVYYLSCQKKVFQMKGLYNAKDFVKGEEEIKTVLQSFNCRKGGL